MNKKSSHLVLCFLILLLSIVVIACANNANDNEATNTGTIPGTNNEDTESGIDWEARIEANKKVGKISFITSFNYAASAPGVHALIASELGYFEELGLDVEVIPGLEAEGMKMIASDRVQFGASGTASTVLQSIDNNAEIKGIAVMSSVGMGSLMVLEESGIKRPKDLEGKIVGYKGALPASFKAMFINDGADMSKIDLVSVGFDPTIIDTTDVDAVTVFKSNEPAAMEELGYNVELIDPEDYGVTSSFGVVVANNDFIEKHPIATEDFLRALFKAQDFIMSDMEETLNILENLSETTYNVETEMNRLKVEMDVVTSSTEEGYGIGWHTEEQWLNEFNVLVETDSVERDLTVDQMMDNSFISNIYDGDKLIWIE